MGSNYFYPLRQQGVLKWNHTSNPFWSGTHVIPDKLLGISVGHDLQHQEGYIIWSYITRGVSPFLRLMHVPSMCSHSFSSTKGVQQALALEELPSGVLLIEGEDKKQEPASASGDAMGEGEEDEEGEEHSGGGVEEEAPDDENR